MKRTVVLYCRERIIKIILSYHLLSYIILPAQLSYLAELQYTSTPTLFQLTQAISYLPCPYYMSIWWCFLQLLSDYGCGLWAMISRTVLAKATEDFMSFCHILSTLCSQGVFHNLPHFGKRAGQKVQREIAVAVQNVEPLFFQVLRA